MGNNKNALQNHSIKPYDDSHGDDMSMYDNMPYKWDEELFQEKKTELYSGNLIKSYKYYKSKPIKIKH